MTQKELVLDYLDKNGSITPMEAFSNLGITKLATVVSELIFKEGHSEIKKEYVSGVNRFGRECYYMRYYL